MLTKFPWRNLWNMTTQKATDETITLKVSYKCCRRITLTHSRVPRGAWVLPVLYLWVFEHEVSQNLLFYTVTCWRSSMLNIKTAVSKYITCTLNDILETIPRRSKCPTLVCFSNILHLHRETLRATLNASAEYNVDNSDRWCRPLCSVHSCSVPP